MSTVDVTQLLTTRLPEEDVELPGGLGTVRVRAMTRAEVHGKEELQRKVERDGSQQLQPGAWERKVLHWCMVDPQLTEGQVKAWMACSPAGEITAVVDTIMRLSGLDDEDETGKAADKSDLPEDDGSGLST